VVMAVAQVPLAPEAEADIPEGRGKPVLLKEAEAVVPIIQVPARPLLQVPGQETAR
jgi:hypothetical protein